ncbi:MAG: thiamine-phosphate kinase [Pseudomonadota bacterium]
MAIDEFSLIERYFRHGVGSGSGVRLGVGDDGALLEVEAGAELVVTVDTLVADLHFPAAADAADIAQRALRVNLSDLAAMAATPRWFLLALTLPEADERWLAGFAAGLAAAATAFGVALVGGDTTRGPLAVSITALGTVPAGQALRRSGAAAGDWVMVTGVLGGAAAALADMRERGTCRAGSAALDARYWRPEPRLADAEALRGLASAAIDISDGLLADLGHLARASGVGAELMLEALPLHAAAVSRFGVARVRQWALGGGDDYELCFTVAPGRGAQLAALPAAGRAGATRIGQLVPGSGVRVRDAAGREVPVAEPGFRHF